MLHIIKKVEEKVGIKTPRQLGAVGTAGFRKKRVPSPQPRTQSLEPSSTKGCSVLHILEVGLENGKI